MTRKPLAVNNKLQKHNFYIIFAFFIEIVWIVFVIVVYLQPKITNDYSFIINYKL